MPTWMLVSRAMQELLPRGLGEGKINKEKQPFKFPSSQPSPAGEGAFS